MYNTSGEAKVKKRQTCPSTCLSVSYCHHLSHDVPTSGVLISGLISFPPTCYVSVRRSLFVYLMSFSVTRCLLISLVTFLCLSLSRLSSYDITNSSNLSHCLRCLHMASQIRAWHQLSSHQHLHRPTGICNTSKVNLWLTAVSTSL